MNYLMEPKQILSKQYNVKEKIIEYCLSKVSKIHDITIEKIVDIVTLDILEKIPDEVLAQIMEYLEGDSLIRFCSMSRRINNICNDRVFWLRKIRKDFPHVEVNKALSGSKSIKNYKKLYIDLYFKKYFMILAVYDTSHTDPQEQTLGKPAFGGKYNDLDYEYPLVVLSIVSHNKDRAKEQLKKMMEIRRGENIGIDQVYPMEVEHVTRLIQEGETGSVKNSQNNFLLYGESISREIKNIYVMFIYTEGVMNRYVNMNHIQFFKTKKEFINWIKKGHLAKHIYEMKYRKKTKEYDVPGYGTMSYEELTSNILKKFGKIQLFVMDNEDESSTYIYLTKVPVQTNSLLKKNI